MAREPIVFCAIEKSASIYIARTLYLGLDMPPIIITNMDHRPMWYIIPEKLDHLVHDGGFAREHLLPTPENIMLLKERGLRMVFHVRDIRQYVLSFANYHFDFVSQGNKQLIQEYRDRGLDVMHWTLEDFIEKFIQSIPTLVRTIQGWLNVYYEGTLPVLVTTYEEFVDDQDAFFKKILAFYDIPEDEFKRVFVPKDWQCNFRNGTKDEWRTALTLEQQERINAMVPEEFFELFNWER